MAVSPCPIIGSFDRQRFLQFSPEDAANWTLVQAPSGKKQMAMYPTLGRRHVRFLEQNKLVFADEPRDLFRSNNYWYVVVDNNIFRVDKLFNVVEISAGQVTTLSGSMYSSFLIAGVIPYIAFVDGQHIYIYREPYTQPDGTFVLDEFFTVTDQFAPKHPTFIATFGNRLVVAERNSSQFNLSTVLLDGSNFDPDTCFTVASQGVFAQASGVIKQFAVLNSTLYILSDFVTDVWSNIPSSLVPAGGEAAVTFPWKNSTSQNWDFGIADPDSLDADFHMISFLAQNQNGLVQVMVSMGDKPERISTKAVDVLFQRDEITGELSPFLSGNADGFLYQYENVIYYRISAGDFDASEIIDNHNSNSIEYNFDTKKWSRVIEANEERCRVQKHVFFDNRHFVTCQREFTVYEFSGQFYNNEIRNPLQTNPQSTTAYIKIPFRYSRITPIINQDDYSEFITDYVEIDFIWGNRTPISTDVPFENAVYVVDEEPDSSGNPVYMTSDDGSYIIAEGSNTEELQANVYSRLFKPHVELYFSDDGGVSFQPADVREFSQLGVYLWRMRWYQLGPSRNRCYKLVCVSEAPMVVIGAVMDVRRVSGGAN